MKNLLYVTRKALTYTPVITASWNLPLSKTQCMILNASASSSNLCIVADVVKMMRPFTNNLAKDVELTAIAMPKPRIILVCG
jgi:hypothetical protein